MSKNLTYTSEELTKYYQSHRDRWEEFYPSEQWVFDRIFNETGDLGAVLDVGCAGGGLGAALTERFQLDSYTGVDIHKGIIAWAQANRRLEVPAEFLADDILTMPAGKSFDLVTSLSCADWNIETEQIVDACWQRVRPGGYFVISLRLTTGAGINDITRSYQQINFSGQDPRPETANYVVFNAREAIAMLEGLSAAPDLVGAYGYWGKPSATAVTPFAKILFTVFYVRKGSGGEMRAELNLPGGIFTGEPS